MRNSGVKTPVIPMYITSPPKKYLYRGIHGYQATEFLENGWISDGAYIPFSRSLDVAESFAHRDGIVLRLDITKLAHGIPWVWFADDAANNWNYRAKKRDVIRSSAPEEEEVLFPPGDISRIRKVARFASGIDRRMYDVSFDPHIRPKSIEGKQIVRRIGQPKRNVNNKVDEYGRTISNWFSKLFV